MRVSTLLIVWTSLSLWALESPARAQTLPELNPPVTVAATFDVSDLCGGLRLSLSPDGLWLASYSTDRSELTIFATDCLTDGVGCTGWKISSISFVSVVGWSNAGELWLVPGDGPTRRFMPQTGTLSEDRVSPLNGLPDKVDVWGVLDVNSHWSSGSPSPSDGGLLGVTFDGYGVSQTWLDRATHQVVIATPAADPAHLTVSGRWMPRAATVTGQDGQNYVVAAGTILEWPSETRPKSLAALHVPRPIIDSGSGHLIGAFDDNSVLSLDGAQASFVDPFDDADLNFIAAISVSEAANTSALRWIGLSTNGALRVRRGRNQVELACPGLRSPSPPEATMQTEDWGHNGRTLMVRRRHQQGPSRGLVVIWPGGPGGTFSMGGADFIEREWLVQGFDTAIVDGSGTLGAELGRRLRDEGFDALLTDARDAARYIVASLSTDQLVIVQGDSFGAVAAAETARWVQGNDDARRPIGLMLQVPWLRYRDPSLYNGDGREHFNVDFMRSSDAAAFGDLDLWERSMEQWRHQYELTSRMIAVFGAADRISRPEDLFKPHPTDGEMDVIIVPAAGHSTASGHAVAKVEVHAWIESFEADPFPVRH